MASFSAAADVRSDLEDKRGLVARLQVTAVLRAALIDNKVAQRRYPNRPDTPRASIEWLTSLPASTMPGLFRTTANSFGGLPKDVEKPATCLTSPHQRSNLSPDKEEGHQRQTNQNRGVVPHAAPSDRALKEIADDEVVMGRRQNTWQPAKWIRVCVRGKRWPEKT